jgi:hypothetical protein
MLAPQFGDPTSVEGGFTTNLGKFSATRALSSSGYSLEYDIPTATTGTLVFPTGSSSTIMLDGEPIRMVRGIRRVVWLRLGIRGVGAIGCWWRRVRVRGLLLLARLRIQRRSRVLGI